VAGKSAKRAFLLFLISTSIRKNVIPENSENKRALLFVRKVPLLPGIEV